MTISKIVKVVNGASIKDMRDQGKWFACDAGIKTIYYDDCQWYWEACVKCGRKVCYKVLPIRSVDNPDSRQFAYWCEHYAEYSEKRQLKYMIKCDLVDKTGILPILAFGDKGRLLMGGRTPEELCLILKEEGTHDFDQTFAERAAIEGRFYVKAKQECYQNVYSLKFRLHDLEEFEFDGTEDAIASPVDEDVEMPATTNTDRGINSMGDESKIVA